MSAKSLGKYIRQQREAMSLTRPAFEDRFQVGACEQLADGLENLSSFKDLDRYWIEIHRLENEGDRISRDAVASLFSNGIDPMVVIRWKDIFAVLEEAIDATEKAAQILEGIVIKNS